MGKLRALKRSIKANIKQRMQRKNLVEHITGRKSRNPSGQYVYSAGCSFAGPITKAGQVGTLGKHKVPCCPHCQSTLFVTDESKWWMLAHDQEKNVPGYTKFLLWIQDQKRCWPTLAEARDQYAKESGINIDLSKMVSKEEAAT